MTGMTATGKANTLNPTETTSHNLKYQAITAESWWCDKCLAQCCNLPQAKPIPRGHWSDFWLWLGRLLVKGYAAALAAAFGLIVFFIYDDDRPVELPADDDTVWKWETQVKWLTVRRHRLLVGLDRNKNDIARAYSAADDEECQRLIILGEDKQHDLIQTQYQLQSLEEKLNRHYRLLASNCPQPNPEFYMAGQIGQTSQHQG
jgi:hypothetical protein